MIKNESQLNIFSTEDLRNVTNVIANANGEKTPPAMMKTDHQEAPDPNEMSKRIQALVDEIDSFQNQDARELMQECMQEILSFYGQGLERILGIISKGSRTEAGSIYNQLIEDSFVSGLLLIHDLHPLDLNTRLHLALEKVKPYMDSHGGNVEVVSLHEGVAKLKLSGSCKGCPSSSSTLELGIKQAIEELCPDLISFEVEGVVDGHQKTDRNIGASDAGWRTLNGFKDMPDGTMRSADIGSLNLLMIRSGNKLYAYRNLCPACDRSFANGSIDQQILACQLGHKFDVQRAGICTDDPDLHLDPFPLLEENGIVKIAVG